MKVTIVSYAKLCFRTLKLLPAGDKSQNPTWITNIVAMINKNNLRTIVAQIVQKLKNNEARSQFTGSYKKGSEYRSIVFSFSLLNKWCLLRLLLASLASFLCLLGVFLDNRRSLFGVFLDNRSLFGVSLASFWCLGLKGLIHLFPWRVAYVFDTACVCVL